MIYAIGDSHATFSFKDVPNVLVLGRRGITLKRMTYVEEELLPNVLQKLPLTTKDYLIFCYGEIDIRCHIAPIISHRKNTTLDELLKNWVTKYISRLSLLNTKGAKIVLMSVVPPVPRNRIVINNETNQKEIIPMPPATGLDADRALYTLTLNKYLKEACIEKEWLYLDVYSKYVDENGMMRNGMSDGRIHIGDTTEVKKLIEELDKKGETKMSDFKDEFEFLQNVTRSTNHRPLLLLALELTKKGDVLELGCGYGSTPYLQKYCKANNRVLYSYDYVEKWAEKFNAIFVNGDWEKTDYYNRKYSVALVDESPAEHRGTSIKNLIDKVDIFVAHDTEISHDKYYNMLQYIKNFKYILHFNKFNRRASIFSNIYDVTPYKTFIESFFQNV